MLARRDGVGDRVASGDSPPRAGRSHGGCIVGHAEPEETLALQEDWERRDIPVALKVLDSPFREITSSVVDYVKSVRRGSPRDVVMVYIPEYVVGRWYEQLLHNQTALRLKSRLFFTPGVMVTSVPWQMRSSQGAEDRFVGPKQAQAGPGRPVGGQEPPQAGAAGGAPQAGKGTPQAGEEARQEGSGAAQVGPREPLANVGGSTEGQGK